MGNTGTQDKPAGVVQAEGQAGDIIGYGVAFGTVTPTANLEVATPILFPAGRVLQEVHFQVSVGGAGSTVRVGVRADNNGYPGTLTQDCGAVGTTAGGLAKATGLAIAGLSGLIWITFTQQGDRKSVV